MKKKLIKLGPLLVLLLCTFFYTLLHVIGLHVVVQLTMEWPPREIICNQERLWGCQKGFHRCSTSKKHGKKEPQSFSHCGSFDHPDLQSVNDCKSVFWFTNSNFKNMRGLNILLDRSWNFKFAVVRPKADCISEWSKEPQWENDCGNVLFYHVFY